MLSLGLPLLLSCSWSMKMVTSKANKEQSHPQNEFVAQPLLWDSGGHLAI